MPEISLLQHATTAAGTGSRLVVQESQSSPCPGPGRTPSRWLHECPFCCLRHRTGAKSHRAQEETWWGALAENYMRAWQYWSKYSSQVWKYAWVRSLDLHLGSSSVRHGVMSELACMPAGLIVLIQKSVHMDMCFWTVATCIEGKFFVDITEAHAIDQTGLPGAVRA